MPHKLTTSATPATASSQSQQKNQNQDFQKKIQKILSQIGYVLIIIGIIYSIWGYFNAASSVSSGISGAADHNLTVPANEIWKSCINLPAGRYEIKASGKVNMGSPGDGADKWIEPDGWPYNPSFRMGRTALYNEAPLGSLVAKVGEKAYFIGQQNIISTDKTEKICFASNDDIYDRNGNYVPHWFNNNRGHFKIGIKRLS